ncbi:S41 family peptidase [Haloferula sp. A504]|uniref:S41 family peptidase n=1 Tax=Haloferula sp. A504 TaxID=3373601 RepID=UPI0031C7AB60|nr:S41 family peptidase [Verrucomicrobiaceae bacterium E54]
MRPLLLLLCLLPAFADEKAPALPDPDEAAYPAIERFVEVLEQVRQRHPDVDKLAYDRLVNHALEGMLGSLDPHSSFIHPEMAAAMAAHPDLDPHIPSLGLTLGLRQGGPYIANVLPGSAAAELLPGSALQEIDGQPTAGLELPTLLSRLTGEAGATVTLKLKSPVEAKPLELTLTHHAIDERAVAESRLLDDGQTGYLRLSSFTDAAPREMEAALDEMEDDGMKRLILDLRGNPGGSLPATVRILGLFLPPETEVVTTRGREMEDEVLSTPERQRRQRDYPIAVLVDRMSASASELTAGALQDLDRAEIVGETSYGKGSVQNIIPMGGGTALRLTIATYHTPSGRTPHLTGVTPDVEVEITEEIRENTALSFRRDTLTPEEIKALEGWTDPVLAAALERLAR